MSDRTRARRERRKAQVRRMPIKPDVPRTADGGMLLRRYGVQPCYPLDQVPSPGAAAVAVLPNCVLCGRNLDPDGLRDGAYNGRPGRVQAKIFASVVGQLQQHMRFCPERARRAAWAAGERHPGCEWGAWCARCLNTRDLAD